MIREMLRISLLLAGATVGLTVGEQPVMAETTLAQATQAQMHVAQATPPPRSNRIQVPLMVPQTGPGASQPTSPARRLNDTQNAVRVQSCASLSGAAAGRCYSDVRTKIIADDLRQRSIDSSLPPQK